MARFFPRIQIVAVAALALSLSACSFWNKDPNRIPAELKDFNSTIGVRQAWQVDVGDSDSYVFRPAVAGGNVYVAGVKGRLLNIEASSGRIVWETKAEDNTITAGPGSDGNVTALGSLKGDVLAFDKNGKQIWKENVSGEIITEPLVGQGLVVVRTIDSRIVALDANTGRRRWVYQRSQTPLALRTSMGMTFLGNSIVTGFSGGKVGAINLNNGSLRWESVISYAKGVSEIERLNDVAGTPSIVGSRACVAAFQGRITCFDVTSGNPLWGQDFSSSSGVAQDGNVVVAVDDKSRVYEFAGDTGNRIWRTDTLIWRKLSGPLLLGRSIAVGDFEGNVHWLSRENGSFLARMKTDGSEITASPVVVGQSVIVQTRKGGVFAFVPN